MGSFCWFLGSILAQNRSIASAFACSNRELRFRQFICQLGFRSSPSWGYFLFDGRLSPSHRATEGSYGIRLVHKVVPSFNRTWPSDLPGCLGLNFRKSFNYPYVSGSITEFWTKVAHFDLHVATRLSFLSAGVR